MVMEVLKYRGVKSCEPSGQGTSLAVGNGEGEGITQGEEVWRSGPVSHLHLEA